MAKLKRSILMALAEEISRQPNIMYAMWLLVFTLWQICNEREQPEQGKVQSVQFEKKGAPGNLLLVSSSVLRKIQGLKKSLLLNGIKGVVPQGKNPTIFPSIF